MSNTRSKFLYIDILAIISSFAVVMLHANGVFWKHPTGTLWITSNIIESVFYFAVPVFFMISGLTLIDFRDRYDIRTYVKKRILRAFVPFLFWSLFFYMLDRFLLDSPPHFKGGLVIGIINTKIVQIYWFFIPLFACYMAIPIFGLLKNKIKCFRYMIVMAFLSYSILPFLEKFFSININHAIQFPIASGYIMYILLGYVIGKSNIEKKIRCFFYILGIICLFLHCYMTIILSPDGQPINKMYKGYLNFPCVFYSIAIFIYFKYINYDKLLKCKLFMSIISNLKSCVLGIYLLHRIFTYMLFPLIFDTTSLTYRLFCPFFVVFLTTIIVKILKRTPLLKYTL